MIDWWYLSRNMYSYSYLSRNIYIYINTFIVLWGWVEGALISFIKSVTNSSLYIVAVIISAVSKQLILPCSQWNVMVTRLWKMEAASMESWVLDILILDVLPLSTANIVGIASGGLRWSWGNIHCQNFIRKITICYEDWERVRNWCFCYPYVSTSFFKIIYYITQPFWGHN